MSASILELRHLRTLAALAESGSVSRAAERVHLTQSALSHQLKALETHYGVAMVRRQGQSVVLTEAGVRLVAAAKEIIETLRVAERDVSRIAAAPRGTLRIALECHTCFDWLMPIMDGFRTHWPEIELDLVSGFHADPLKLLADGQADVVIGSETPRRRGVVYHPMFRFEIVAVLAPQHPLAGRRALNAGDFADQTLITYPVPEDRIDLIRRVLKPARVQPARRTAELTVAILQLVASQRGIAALPNWGIKNYVDYDYVVARRIGAKGLWSDLYAATTREAASLAYMQDFLETARGTCFATLDGLVPIK